MKGNSFNRFHKIFSFFWNENLSKWHIKENNTKYYIETKFPMSLKQLATGVLVFIFKTAKELIRFLTAEFKKNKHMWKRKK